MQGRGLVEVLPVPVDRTTRCRSAVSLQAACATATLQVGLKPSVCRVGARGVVEVDCSVATVGPMAGCVQVSGTWQFMTTGTDNGQTIVFVIVGQVSRYRSKVGCVQVRWCRRALV